MNIFGYISKRRKESLEGRIEERFLETVDSSKDITYRIGARAHYLYLQRKYKGRYGNEYHITKHPAQLEIFRDQL